jgi:DNA adenine methylase
MRYPGGKSRLAKHLLPVILEHRTSDGQLYVEPFCGGCNMLDKVVGNRWGNDTNKYVIAFFQRAQEGWLPPETLTEAEYKDIKAAPDHYTPELVAHAAINCSFAGKWFGGFARDRQNVNYSARGRRHIEKQIRFLSDVRFTSLNYLDMKIPDNSIIYCDPPYRGAMKYRDGIDHNAFFSWVRKLSENNHVYVSEHKAPGDFECVLEIEHKTMIDIKQHDRRVERLFKYKP